MLVFSSRPNPESPTEYMIFMGKDKFENEDLLKYADPIQDIWFHVDKYSSAHVYVRLPQGTTVETIPVEIIEDAAQLVKANSIEGNKLNNITVIYTPTQNVKKDGSMETGQVTFHNFQKVKRTHVAIRKNVIVNRLNKTKKTIEMTAEDYQTDALKRKKENAERERQEREMEETRQKEAQLQKQKRGPVDYHQAPVPDAGEDAEMEEWLRKQKVEDFDPDEDFM